MENFTISDKASIEINEENKTITMNWNGIVDSENANSIMRDFLVDFHTQCKTKGIQKLISNFSRITFMFSSGIKTLISWFKLITDDKFYDISVLYNNKVRWQDVTFESIRIIIKNIELKGIEPIK
ncbi:MAG: hypothetical protein JW881_14630 [Spirochaetales bacterium]|nr:hypothetical protein [Spirochaetales bacterium]